MDCITQFTHNLRSVPVNADSVKIIETPQEFYETLIRLTKSAERRLVLSTLYFGESDLERKFVGELEKALDRCPNLRMNILLDFLRGTRSGQKDSSVSLLKRLVPRASVHLFHTPHLRGMLKKSLPERANEIIGLQHMKLYIFDDNIIISGANLSESYFTNRQDRYILIEHTPKLADFFDSLVYAVCSCSFSLRVDGGFDLHHECEVHPYKGSLAKYGAMIRERVLSVLNSLPLPTSASEVGTSKECDTRVYPLVQMGMFSVNQEYNFLKELFSCQDESLSLTLTSGYFNFVDDYGDLISKCGRYSMDIIFASPQANGFYQGSGLSGHIPSLYVLVSKLFFCSTRSDVRLFEYTRPEWTYHAKGLWFESSRSPFAGTLVGSSNYGYRSVHRDLEAQLLIVTSNEQLKRRLYKEHSSLLECSSLVEAATFLRPDHRVPFWIRSVSRYIRNFF